MKKFSMILIVLIALFVVLPGTSLASDFSHCKPVILAYPTYHGDGTGHELVFVVSQPDQICEDNVYSLWDGIQKITYYPGEGYYHYQTFDADDNVTVLSWDPFVFEIRIDVTDQFLKGYHWYQYWIQAIYGDPDSGESIERWSFTSLIEGTDQVMLTTIALGAADGFTIQQLDDLPYPDVRTGNNRYQTQQRQTRR